MEDEETLRYRYSQSKRLGTNYLILNAKGELYVVIDSTPTERKWSQRCREHFKCFFFLDFRTTNDSYFSPLYISIRQILRFFAKSDTEMKFAATNGCLPLNLRPWNSRFRSALFAGKAYFNDRKHRAAKLAQILMAADKPQNLCCSFSLLELRCKLLYNATALLLKLFAM